MAFDSILYSTIFNCIKNENDKLESLDPDDSKGIFYAPELYIAFLLGKTIKENEQAIFGEKAEWIREVSFKNELGPVDFAFHTESGRLIIFELKLRDKLQAYEKDIQKLKSQDSSCSKYFLALIDSWENDKLNDERILKLEAKYPEIIRIASFESFETKQRRYKRNKIVCTIALWEIVD